ncbi:MAG: hypothetical protein NC044_00010 [Prevotella sp.]|nr:hypothetical protein [Bacteroides sp.]MCM1444775.1 hypothetical protein [Prevotella sp.]
MRRIMIVPALLAAWGCSTQKQSCHREVRTDSFRAVMSERMCVSLDDVIVLPRDSIAPIVIARRAEVKRKSEAAVTRVADEAVVAVEQEKAETPRLEVSPLGYLPVMIIALLFCRLLYKVRHGD